MHSLPAALNYVRRFGIRKTLRRALKPHVSRLPLYLDAVIGPDGLEVGGPSPIFETRVPLYRAIGSLDNAVYAAETIWAKNNGVFHFHPKKPAGRNFILDATNLHGIPTGRYNFVLSSHCLEHVANPIKALKEWQRVTKPGGALILVLPHYRWTFDHLRPLTTVEHMLADYQAGRTEADSSHIDEILQLHDLKLDPAAETAEQFRKRAVAFTENRSIHHHTFTESTAAELLQVAGYHVQDVQVVEPWNIVLLANAQRAN